jgi:16S rRNA G966 N2-methylase RsmD
MEVFVEILSSIVGENWPTIISSIVGILTIVIWLLKIMSLTFKSYKNRHVKPGIYLSAWVDPIKKEINFTISKLTRLFGKFSLKVLYIHKDRHNYKISLESYKKHQDIFSGYWEAQGSNSIYKGPVLFKFKSDIFEGWWIGPKENHDINAGLFRISYLDGSMNEYMLYKTRPWFYWISQIKLPANRSVTADIINKHENGTAQKFVYKGVTLDIPSHSFNPQFGKVSTHLLEYTKSSTLQKSRVLDLGSGTGFYAITLAKVLNCCCTGVDIDSKEISVAESNAGNNGVDQLTDFRLLNSKDPFGNIRSNEKFDLIIANLPFSRESKTWKSRKHPMYNCFSGSRILIEKLILGSLYHINQEGRLVFAYAVSD